MKLRSLTTVLARLIWLCMAPLVLLAIWLAWNHLQDLEASHLREGVNLARNFMAANDRFVDSRLSALNLLAVSPLVDDPQQWPALYREAQGFVESFGAHVIFADAQRQMLFNTRQPFGTALPRLPLSKGRSAAPLVLETGQPQVGDLVFGPVAKTTTVALAVPVLREGRPMRLMLCTLESRQFQRRMEQLALPVGWSIALQDGTGADIARRSPPGFDGARDVDADHRFVIPSERSAWSVVLEIPRSSHTALHREAMLYLGGSILLAALLGLGGGVQASRRISRQMVVLAGPEGGATPVLDITEIEAARCRLVAAATELEASHEQLQMWGEAFRRAEVGVAIADGSSNTLVAVNPAFVRERGYSEDELIGQPVLNLYPADRHDEARAMLPSLEQTGHLAFESEHLRRDGSRFPVQVDLTILRDADGKPIHRLAFVLDISERKRAEQALAANRADERQRQRQARIAVLNQMQDANTARAKAEAAEAEVRLLSVDLERRVAERTTELTVANQELDAFAYAVSHDLRAPLRAMSGFAQALEEDFGGQLQGEAKTYLDQIGIASHRMADLIEGILILSRSTRGELRRDRVDLSALARRRLDELVAAEPARQVRYSVEDGLVATGDARMLEVVMTNLLDNAWKYTDKTEAPEIRVFAEARDGRRGFCVADNGAGFDMAHAARLFQPFQRLHRQDEFPGIGIGLATVQRIIHRHGGEIEAHGEPGQGARFCFTLPEA